MHWAELSWSVITHRQRFPTSALMRNKTLPRLTSFSIFSPFWARASSVPVRLSDSRRRSGREVTLLKTG